MNILIINGPNLNLLGKRDNSIYGDKNLSEINSVLENIAKKHGVKIDFHQSNSEGSIIDFIQERSDKAVGIIINPGALAHYGLSLRDALVDTGLPIIEVHLSNIFSREDWRSKSVISPVVKGQITGLGWRGYYAALQTIISDLKGVDWD